MSLHSNDLSKLAKVLARCFPEYEMRMRLASKAEVAAKAQVAGQALEAWRDIVHCAQAAGNLDVLIEAALLEQPGNADLKRYRVLPGEGKKKDSFGHLWVVLALLLAGLGAYSCREDVQEKALEAVLTPALEVMYEDHGKIRAGPKAGPESDKEEARVPEPEVVAADQAPVKASDEGPALTEERPEASGRCGGQLGELVGYFYAGDHVKAAHEFQARAGQPYTLTGDVNVRADYPRKENDWSSGAAKRCVLLRGDVLTLSESPFDVDGGAVWVPLHAGDLQAR